jgi:hypothetical protein
MEKSNVELLPDDFDENDEPVAETVVEVEIFFFFFFFFFFFLLFLNFVAGGEEGRKGQLG